MPADIVTKRSLSYRDLPVEQLNEVRRQFEDALLPLDSAGKLGALLLQFPPWFFSGDEQREHFLLCEDKLKQYGIAVEFRHQSWVNEKNIDRTMEFLTDNSLAYVLTDEPQGFKSGMPSIAGATSEIGVVRLHGRNVKAWEGPSEAASGRFNYLCSEQELGE